mgnify:CR=1 FL=1
MYVASSWRNVIQPDVIKILLDAGHEVYDFRNPCQSGTGFHWSDIASDWEHWSPEKLIAGLEHPLASKGFRSDMDALDWAEAVVMVMPCGRSSHLELGYAVGKSKKTVVLLTQSEPELMYKMADYLVTDTEKMLLALVD